MTASAILERAAREGVEVSLCGNGKLKACGPRAALAKWLPTLKAMKPAIIDSATTAARERERIEAQLSRPCPDDLSPERWERAQAGAVQFAEQWAAQAMHLGWISTNCSTSQSRSPTSLARRGVVCRRRDRGRRDRRRHHPAPIERIDDAHLSKEPAMTDRLARRRPLAASGGKGTAHRPRSSAENP